MLSRIFQLSCILIVFSQVISSDSLNPFVTCDGSDQPIYLPNTVDGTISVKRSKNNTGHDCIFKAKQGDDFVALKLDGFRLYRNETLTISEGIQNRHLPVVLRPPINYNYVIVKLIDATFSFDFKVRDDTVQNLTFYQYDNFLNLTSDSDDVNIKILPVYQEQLSLGVDNHDQAMHLQFDGAELDSTGLRNHLVTPNITRDDIEIKFSGLSPITIKTSKVSSECSNKYNLGLETTQNIVGLQTINRSYKCVNLFTSPESSVNSHYEINVNKLNANDTLTYDDSNTIATLNMDNQLALTKGNNFALIYESQFNDPAQQSNLDVSVTHTSSGGQYSNGILVFPKNTISNHTRFSIPTGRVVSLQKSVNLSPASSLSVLSKGELLGKFTNYIPLMISSDNDMILDFAGTDFSAFNHNFDVVANNPNSTHIMTVQDEETLDIPSSNSYLTLSSNSSKFMTISSDVGKFCFTMTNLIDLKNTLICSNEILPKMVVNQAHLNFTEGNQITVQIVPMNIATNVKLDNKSQTVSIISPGYPISYPTGLPTQVNLLNTTQNYLLHIDTLELRKQEKLFINNQFVGNYLEDLFVNSTNITIARPPTNDDVNQRKGYNISLVQFDKLITVGPEQNSITLPVNVTSVVIKKKTQIGKNIGFDIKTTTASLNGTLSVSDGSSISNSKIEVVKNSGLSTSNTILFVFKAPASKLLPNDIKIDFNYKPCNASTGFMCDNKTRCVPFTSLCQGQLYCQDKSDLHFKCQNPKPVIIEGGYSGTAVFFLSLFMITLGVMGTLYGPGLYKSLEGRFRAGSYSAFSSVE